MEYDAKQLQVIQYLDNCLVGACPGSGKTRVLVGKVRHILDSDPSSNNLVVSYTADSAREIKERLYQSSRSESVRRHVASKIGTGTFHSICLKQLSDAKIKGTIITDGQRQELVARAIIECGLNIPLEEAIYLIDEAKIDPEFDVRNDDQGRLFCAYSNLTEQNNVIDFIDMLSKTVRLMREGLIPPIKCHHLLVDEGQDIDRLQYAWCAEHLKNGAKITVVGDDDQSIYRFRRALGYKGMLQFHQEYNARLFTLDTNYRCHSEILVPAKVLIELNEERVKKDLKSSKGPGGKVIVWHCGSADAEAEMLVNAISDSCRNNPVPRPKMVKDKKTGEEISYIYMVGVRAKQWAVFARNKHNLRIITSALKGAGIPYVSPVSDIWDDRPVCFVLALIRSIITNEKSGYDAALHYAGLDNEILAKLHQELGSDFSPLFENGISFDDYGTQGAIDILKDVSTEVRKWKRIAKKEFADLLIANVFDWFRRNHRPLMTTSEKDRKKAKNRTQSEMRKLDMAERLMLAQTGNLLERIDRLRSKPDPDNLEVVNVGTLHSSKGLEFDNVWIATVDEGIIPDQKDTSLESEEEERRLFYVGMTRAKNGLFISSGEFVSTFVYEAGLIPEKSPNFRKGEKRGGEPEIQRVG